MAEVLVGLSLTCHLPPGAADESDHRSQSSADITDFFKAAHDVGHDLARKRADFTLMGWLLRICPLDRLNIALCKQTEALSNRCASLAATDCIELAVLLQACNRLH